MATMEPMQADRDEAVTQAAEWIAAAAGHVRPSPLDRGDAADMLDGLVADGLMRWS